MSGRYDWRERVDARLEGREPEPARRKKKSVRKKKVFMKPDDLNAPGVGGGMSVDAEPDRESETLAASAADELPTSESRRSLRNWVLTICFAWGLVTGFAFYSFRTVEDDIDTDTRTETPGDNGPGLSGGFRPTDSASRPKAAPIKGPVQIDDSGRAPIDLTRIAERSRDTAGANPSSASSGALPLPKTPYGGLTGMNAPMPTFKPLPGTKPAPGSAPAQPAAPRISGPELDL